MKKKYLKQVTRDLYDISRRIREIDRFYRIMFDCRSEKFEVHNLRQAGNTYCLTVPFDRLDERTLTLVRKTRVARAEDVFKDIEKHNHVVEKSLQDDVRKKTETMVEDMLCK